MATRTPWAGTVVDGEIADQTDFNSLPGGWIGYATTTTDQSGITTDTDLTGLSVTVSLPADRTIVIQAFAPITSTVAGDRAVLTIKEGATVLQQGIVELDSTLAQCVSPLWIGTPTAGSHTYKVSLARGGGASGTLSTSHASAARQSLIAVIDIGPAS